MCTCVCNCVTCKWVCVLLYAGMIIEEIGFLWKLSRGLGSGIAPLVGSRVSTEKNKCLCYLLRSINSHCLDPQIGDLCTQGSFQGFLLFSNFGFSLNQRILWKCHVCICLWEPIIIMFFTFCQWLISLVNLYVFEVVVIDITLLRSDVIQIIDATNCHFFPPVFTPVPQKN